MKRRNPGNPDKGSLIERSVNHSPRLQALIRFSEAKGWSFDSYCILGGSFCIYIYNKQSAVLYELVVRYLCILSVRTVDYRARIFQTTILAQNIAIQKIFNFGWLYEK